MKRILPLFLAALMLLSALAFTSCTAPAATIGLGVQYTAPAGTDADGDTNGKGTVTATAAAVLIKGDKIVACAIDAADLEAKYSSDGKYAATAPQTKNEIGDNYGMTAYGGAKLEWYQQAEAFAKVCVGKTAAEIKSLAAEGGMGNDEVVTAGCTINVADFVLAVEKACNNAASLGATTAEELKLAITTAVEGKDASEDGNGNVTFTTTFAAVAVDPHSAKVTAAVIDEADAKFEFTVSGESATKDGTIATKREQGDSYGMVAYGGATLEWYQQADALASVCKGKDATQIAAGSTDEIVKAGCTISATDMVKTVVKAASVNK